MRNPKLIIRLLAGLLLMSSLAACTLFNNTPTPGASTPSVGDLATATGSVSNTAAPSLEPSLPAIITATPEPSVTPQPGSTPAPTSTKQPALSATPTGGATATSLPALKILNYQMFDTSSGWTVGQYQPGTTDEILRTTDGAKTWKKRTPPEPALTTKKAVAFFLDASHAWVTYIPASPTKLANVTVWHTSDSGATWKSSTIDVHSLTGDYFAPSSLGFSDANNGWMLAHMGAGMMKDYVAILRTADGGATWKVVVSFDINNLPATGAKNGVYFIDASYGFIAGSYNGVMPGLAFYKTKDGGATWKVFTLPDPAGFAGIYTKDNMACEADNLLFHSATWGQVLVRCSDLNATKDYRWLYYTYDGGNTWAALALPGPWGVLFFLDKDTGWYLASPSRDSFAGSKIYKTKDHGQNWTLISDVGWSGQMEFVDAKNGWVNAGAGGAQVLVRSVDSGITWGLVNPGVTP